MGISPAPPIANSYVANFKLYNIFEQFQDFLLLYLRFIGDGIAIWQHGNNKAEDSKAFEDFKTAINKSGLTQEFTTPGHAIDFMDMQIELGKRKIETNLFQMPLALHLYVHPSQLLSPSRQLRQPHQWYGPQNLQIMLQTFRCGLLDERILLPP